MGSIDFRWNWRIMWEKRVMGMYQNKHINSNFRLIYSPPSCLPYQMYPKNAILVPLNFGSLPITMHA